MGLFSFLKEKGEALKMEHEAKKVEVTTPSPANTAPAIAEARTKAANAALLNYLQQLGLNVQNAQVTMENGKIVVNGDVEDQATKEKVVLALGNLNGVGEVEENLNVLNPQPEAQFYTVQSGDSLSKIAKHMYGDAMKYPQIFEANKPMLSDPNKIFPGQVLRIPGLN